MIGLFIILISCDISIDPLPSTTQLTVISNTTEKMKISICPIIILNFTVGKNITKEHDYLKQFIFKLFLFPTNLRITTNIAIQMLSKCYRVVHSNGV